jgi:hypothetical protein
MVAVTMPKANNHFFFLRCLISFNDLVIFKIGRSIKVENSIRRNATKRKLTLPMNLYMMLVNPYIIVIMKRPMIGS